jgi:hypothetical protein
MQALGGQLLGIAFNDEEMRPCGLYGAALRRGFFPGRRHENGLRLSLDESAAKDLMRHHQQKLWQRDLTLARPNRDVSGCHCDSAQEKYETQKQEHSFDDTSIAGGRCHRA